MGSTSLDAEWQDHAREEDQRQKASSSIWTEGRLTAKVDGRPAGDLTYIRFLDRSSKVLNTSGTLLR